MTIPLTVIVPVYNGAEIIANNVVELLQFLRQHFNSFELIVVNDGSTDHTANVLASINDPQLVILNLAKNLGKFGAIKAAIHTSKGDCCLFTDADLPYNLNAIPYAYQLISQRGFHLVTGDRHLPESVSDSNKTMVRSLASKVFSLLVRLSVTGEIYDTQCGFKALKGDVARILFSLLRDASFSGDVELLYIALKYNLAIRRIPVCSYKGGKSTVSIGKDALLMMLRIIRLPLQWRMGYYENIQLRKLTSQRYQ